MDTIGIIRKHRDPNTDLGQGIYVVTTEDGFPSKIGVTSDLALRLSQLQTGNWVRLKAHWFSFCFGPYEGDRMPSVRGALTNGAFGLEDGVMCSMKQLDAHISGEWVAATADECVAVIKKVAKMGKYRLAGIEVLQSLGLYDSIDKRQFLYYDSMINAEKSARRAISMSRENKLDNKSEIADFGIIGS